MKVWRLDELGEALGVPEERAQELCVALRLKIRPAGTSSAGPTVRLTELQFDRLSRLVGRGPMA